MRVPHLPGPLVLPAPELFGPVGDRWLSAYASATHAVGWLGFDAPFAAVAELVLDCAEGLGHLVVAAAGGQPLAVELTRDGRTTSAAGGLAIDTSLVDPADPEPVACLGAGGAVRLRGGAGEILVVHEAGRSPFLDDTTFNRQRQLLGAPVEGPPVSLHWSFPVSDAGREAAAREMHRAILWAAHEPGCLGGFAGAGGPSPIPGPVPYELLAGTAPASTRARWLRTHARTPAWRVVVPRGAPPPVPVGGVRVTPTAAGWFVESLAPDPFRMDDALREAMERAVVGSCGTREEATASATGG